MGVAQFGEATNLTYRYIGSKARVADAIAQKIGVPNGKGRFVDLFCGTGVIAETAAKMGWDVHLNDHLHSAVVMAAARLTSHVQAPFAGIGGYKTAVAHLNAAKPQHGLFTRSTAPLLSTRLVLERRYFSTENAAMIDAMRRQIAAWTEEGLLQSTEERLLLADL